MLAPLWMRRETATVMTVRCQARSACALRAVAWKPQEHTDIPVSATAVLLSGKYVAFGGDSGLVQMVSVPDGKLVARYALPPSTRVTCLQWSSEGGYLAAVVYGRDEGEALVRVGN